MGVFLGGQNFKFFSAAWTWSRKLHAGSQFTFAAAGSASRER